MISDSNLESRDDLVLSTEFGEVNVLLAGQPSSELASASQLVFEGDQVMTGEGSYASLSFQNGSQIVLDENTRLLFSTATVDGKDDQFHFELKDGRVWTSVLPKESGEFQMKFYTDVMDISMFGAEALISNRVNEEYVVDFSGNVDIDFVERSLTGEDLVIERESLSSTYLAYLDDESERALLDREPVNLVQEMGLRFENDDFLTWARGDAPITVLTRSDIEIIDGGLEEESETIEETPLEGVTEVEEEEPVEEVVEEEPEEDSRLSEALRLEITSPTNPYTVDDGAEAIVGRITSGYAQSVWVTWSGDGVSYQLGLFEPGGEDFRYVADTQYSNIKEGENTYTIVAYDSDGEVSSSVSVVLDLVVDSL